MANLAASRNTVEDIARGKYVTLPVEAATTIYLGSLCGVDAAGNAVPGQSAVKIVGRAERVAGGFPGQDAVNAGAAGAISLVVARFGPFAWDINSSDIAEANIGALAYAVDDHTVSSSSNGGARPIAGRIVGFDATSGGVWIDSTDQAITNGLATLSFAGLKTLAAAGVASAGPVTLTGATVGQRVLSIFGAPTAGGAMLAKIPGTDFESVISVAGEIQQLVGSLSTDTFIFLLAPAES